jgi:DUF971 family protein
LTAPSQEPRPVDITLDREQHELRIKWADGTDCRYPLGALRAACPCALCRGGHEFMGKLFDPDLRTLQPSKKVTVREITMVGNYALNILWDDLHDQGIYSWDYLYRICPQEER